MGHGDRRGRPNVVEAVDQEIGPIERSEDTKMLHPWRKCQFLSNLKFDLIKEISGY